MIFEGKFKSIDNKFVYYLKIGDTGITRQIQEGNIDAYNDGKILCFAGESPITIQSDTSDTFEHVYIRSATVTLVSNYDIREYVVASNYMDIPIIIKSVSANVADKINVNNWLTVFNGFVNPMSFNQPFALKWNEFELECTDKLGVLEYKKFPELLMDAQGNIDTSYKTPREFIDLALSICKFSVNYDIQYDHTSDTKINPAIFMGDSEDDWMTCKEVLEEIGKLYGCYFWQNGGICYVRNILLYDLNNPYEITKDDYMSDDANISVDTAYNLVKCEVDISSIDSDFINPFDKDAITPTTKWPERILTEFIANGESKSALNRFINMLKSTSTTKDWSTYKDATYKECEIYDHYAQIMKNDKFEFSLYDANNQLTRPSYLDDISVGGGGGNSETNAITTINWLKEHPGNGAFIGYGTTSNVIDQSNTSSINIGDMKKALIIQIGGQCSDAESERNRLQLQIEDNIPICTYKVNSSFNITPNDISTINYLLINGSIILNPVQEKTGIRWTGNNNNIYSKSQNTVKECLQGWGNETDFTYKNYNTSTLLGRFISIRGDGTGYYQNLTWENTNDEQNYPFNQNPITNDLTQYQPQLKVSREKLKWEGSYYKKSNASEVDDLYYVPILACELKIGDKYLCEDVGKMKEYNFKSLNPTKLQEIYKWCTKSEAEALGLGTYFTIGIDPNIGDYIIGKEHKIKETTNISFGLDKNGFAIPIPYSAGLNGEVTLKILGPVNAEWVDVDYDNRGWWLWKKYWTTQENKPLLTYVENIIITDLSFELVSDNQRKEQLNDDNDLVYYSATTDRYVDEQSFSCKFCTSLTTDEVNALGIDYNLNNSSIVDVNGKPWTGMRYKEIDGVKLEEARVSEQYAIWNKPRNIFEATLKLSSPEKCYVDQNYTIPYFRNQTYKLISREIDLKQNTMTCKMKDFS